MTSNRLFVAQDVADRRQWSRFALPTPEPLTISVGGRDYNCLVEDISLGGARLRCPDGTPPPTEFQAIHASGGGFRADCKWHDGDCIGLEFDQSHAALMMVSHCVKRVLPGHGGTASQA